MWQPQSTTAVGPAAPAAATWVPAPRKLTAQASEVAYPEGHPKANLAAAAAAAGLPAPGAGAGAVPPRPAVAAPPPHARPNLYPVPYATDPARGRPLYPPLPGQQVPGLEDDKKKKRKPKTVVRAAGGEVWDDPTLLEWDSNDFRLFAGDLGNEVTDEVLTKAFSKYPSLLRTHVVRDKRTLKSKGYGFISFSDPADFAKAFKEMNGI
ncbi:MAG: hypothetical protein BJ554DRAFT_6722 [Olpidium bornovanus]|uniref:RRM domain-containing protein n=1 Tax=Olpidium bornovanus TaxID=278681 RepID=A0A8H7ZY55_9FUNG|nr:MAG: hypothetical protein BJ554DRAFT_6722 [Olpidium bornovanus]